MRTLEDQQLISAKLPPPAGSTAAASLLDAALVEVESASIRSWVQGQRDLWLQIVAAALVRKPDIAPTRIAAYIVCVALG